MSRETTPLSSDFLASISAVCLGMVSRSAARAATRVFAAHLGSLDLQAVQFPILVMVRLHGDEGISGLAARLDIDASTLTRNVQLLERKGLVISRGGRGRGGKRLSLSPDGEAMLAQAIARWRAAQQALLAELGQDGASMLRRSLKRLEEAADRAEHRGAVYAGAHL